MALSQTIERLNRFPFDIDLKMTYCDILMKMERHDDAAVIIDELEDTFLKLSKIYAHMGDIQMGREQYQEAVLSYKKFLYLNPKSGKAAKIRQILHSFHNNSKTEAKENGDEESQNINQVAPHFRTLTMAELYIRQGHPDMAAEILKEILRNEPDNQTAADRLHQITNPPINATGSQDKQKTMRFIAELEKWIKNINRVRNYAA